MLLLIVGLAASDPVEAALKYRFTTTTEGTYGRRAAGTVVVDGAKWRMTYDSDSEAVTDLTSIIGTGEGLIALNEQNQTWFRLMSRKRIAIADRLFTFGEGARASKVNVFAEPAEAGSSMTRVTFSYRLATTVSSMKVGGDVWGEVRVWTTARVPAELPWKPFELRTGFDEVDRTLDAAMAKIAGSVWQSEIEVSRRLDGGAILKQRVRRTISDVTTISVHAALFAVPSTYRYQEPVIGAPGASQARGSPRHPLPRRKLPAHRERRRQDRRRRVAGGVGEVDLQVDARPVHVRHLRQVGVE